MYKFVTAAFSLVISMPIFANNSTFDILNLKGQTFTAEDVNGRTVRINPSQIVKAYMYGKKPVFTRAYFELNFDNGSTKSQIKVKALDNIHVGFSEDSYMGNIGNWMELSGDELVAEGGGIQVQYNEAMLQRQVIQQNVNGKAICNTLKEVEVCEGTGASKTCRDVWEDYSYDVNVKGNLEKLVLPISAKIISNGATVATFNIAPVDYRFNEYPESLDANCPDRIYR